MASLVYDASRQRLYTTDTQTGQVDVFDLVAQQYLTPIPVGSSPVGLALTPDRSTLVVANAGGSSMSIIDLAGNAGTKTVSLASLSGLPQQCGPPIPYAVATTSKNQAMVAFSCTNVEAGQFVLLDLSTDLLGCGNSAACATLTAQIQAYALFLSSTADGTKVFVSNGFIGLWDVNADKFTSQPFLSPGFVPGDFTPSAADGTVFATGDALVDPSLFLTSEMQDVDYLATGINQTNTVFGVKLHDSGALLYVPQTNGLDIYDSHHGHILRRISLPAPVSPTFDSLAIDSSGSKAFLISTTGLMVVDIPDLPVSLGYASPGSGAAVGGVTVRLRGSGFQSGATVSFGTHQAVVTFLDSNTLQVTTPTLPVGPTRITIVNPDGTAYSLDDAFVAQ